MNSIRRAISVWLVIALTGLGLTAGAQRRPYRVSDYQIDQIIRRIETRADRFRASIDLALDRSPVDGSRAEDDINRFVRDFETATDQLRSRFNSRTSAAGDVENVLNRAADIDSFMTRNRLTMRAQNDWSLLKSDLNALANAYGVTWQWGGRTFPTTSTGQRPYRMSDYQLEQIIRRVETNADRFRASLNTALNRSTISGTRREDRINDLVRDFEAATDQLRSRFDSRTSATTDVENVLNRAADIDRFMTRNGSRLTMRAQNDWTTLRSNLDALANAYNVAWDWNNRSLPATTAGNLPGTYGNNTYGVDARLTGTFRLDRTRSDDPRTVADRATRHLPYNERQVVYDRVLERLDAPEMLAIERRGQSVTIASTRAPQTTFEADGRERTEQLPNGVVARVSATLTGDMLTVSSTGFRENDFNVTFEPRDNGQTLLVTRRIFSERLPQPTVVQNTYIRTADVAQWNVYGGAGTSTPPVQTGAAGDYIVRDNEVIVATLNTNLSTRESQNGDRFTMTVREPAQFAGANIEGTISNVSRGGRVTGRSEMSFNFETIRLRNGQTYRFSGIVDSIHTLSGETVQVDNEGSAKDDNQTNRTVQRAAIGTAVGAIIGAIAGGGKGAAIGAIIGAAGGAGSVYVQGRDDLELASGTEVTIRASAPNR